MLGKHERWRVRVTDEATGDSVTLSSNHWRSQRKARDAAIQILISRAYARKMGLRRGTSEIARYDLPDDELSPSELRDYRSAT